MQTATKERKRVAAGIPTGGRFAAQKRDESGISLTSSASTERVGSRTLVDARAAIELATLHARARNNKTPLRNLHWEDIAQEALTSIRVSTNNDTVEGYTPGLISAAVSLRVAAAINTKQQIRVEDAKATGMLRDAVDLESQMLGRDLTSREVIGLAGRIRDTWEDPRHRPQKEFYRRFMEVPIDPLLDSAVLEKALNDGDVVYLHDDNSATRMADEIESGHMKASEGRARAWDALAGIWDVPCVSQTQSKYHATKGRTLIKDSGGLSTVVNTYLADRVMTPQAQAVFAPFGTPDNEDRRAIAQALASRPQVAERLWRSASDGSIASAQ